VTDRQASGPVANTTHVTAEAMTRHFARWADLAMRVPVTMTRHGRPRIVLLSAETYAGLLVGQGEPGVGKDHAGADAALAMILDHTSEGFFACDEALRFIAVNSVFETLTGQAAQNVIGKPLAAVFSDEQTPILAELLRSTIKVGEVSDVIIETGNKHLAIRAFPYRGGVAGLVLNRTRELSLRAKWERYQAVERALGQLSGVALIRLNLRGVFERVDAGFEKLVGFGAEELQRFRLGEIVRPRDRASFARAFEEALQGQAASVTTTLLGRGGAEMDVEMAVSLVRRDGRGEAIVVLVRSLDDPRRVLE